MTIAIYNNITNKVTQLVPSIRALILLDVSFVCH